MADIQKYIFQVICCAFVCAILNFLVQETKFQEIIKMINALILTLTIIQPIGDLNFDKMLQYDISYIEDAAYYRDIGEGQAQKALKQRIKEELETYILAEAKETNSEVTVEVMVGQDLTPEKVYLHGKVTPSAKQHLESFLTSQLSVAKENQIWTG